MSKLHLYLLTGCLTFAGFGFFFYKAYVIGFPLAPATKATIWNVETRIKFVGQGKPCKVALFIPKSSKRFALVDEQFFSGEFGLVAQREEINRRATWSIRKSSGVQNLYYQSVIRKTEVANAHKQQKAPKLPAHTLEGPQLEAAKALLAVLKAKSADTPTLVAQLIKRLNKTEPDAHEKLLLGAKPSLEKTVKTTVNVLTYASIPARAVNGIRLPDSMLGFSKKVELLRWLEVYHKGKWLAFNPVTGESRVPDDWMPWWRGSGKLVKLDGGTGLHVAISVSPKIEDAVTAAARDAKASRPILFKLSLFSLPVNTQAVYRIILMVPVGVLLLVILRNVVGIKTFGTFMPVLIGLSFRETGLWKGVFLFTLLVALGLAVRFYLERLKLLVVPRLAAVLTVVVGLMAVLSIVTHKLGGHTGLSVALFPMVILAMTIERMSIVWEERGAQEALVSGLGSIVTAALAFAVMNIKFMEHLVFVFPELLLVLLAIMILLGRYTGYRLTDLYRFRELAKG